MGVMMDRDDSSLRVLTEYRFYIPHTDEALKLLESLGWVKCSGNTSSWRDIGSIAVMPFQQKWWTNTCSPDFTIERESLTRYFIQKKGDNP